MAAVKLGVVAVSDRLTPPGSATGLGGPSTPCACMQPAKCSMSRLAWATDIRAPLMLTVPEALGWEARWPEPQAAIRAPAAIAPTTRGRSDVDLSMPHW